MDDSRPTAVTPSQDPAAPKPKLVFFRLAKPGLPGFVQQHLGEHVECMKLHFDVVVITRACDYAEVCEEHRPQLALFESGVYAGPGRRITNAAAHPEIPKLGFLDADAYCSTRSVFLSDMEHWGVETFFTLSVAMAEYTPEIADRLFVWANFVDPRVFRDYQQPKNIPVLFTGSQAAHYPWRNRVYSAVTPRYPCLTTPHRGWFDQKAAGNMVQGVPYATLLNSSCVAPTCGTIAREVVRKHFEIPASRTCLVTERTRALEEAGFVDMQNVVFADPDDVLEKLDSLFAHPEEMRRITDAGYELVHARHTMSSRDQVHQWYVLNGQARAGERIVQAGPFGDLRLVPSSSGAGNAPVISGGRDRALLHEGERLLRLGQHAEAKAPFRRCLNFHFMSEPLVGLARCELASGDPAGAIACLSQTIEDSLVDHAAQDPDPVEWGLLVRALLCRGDLREALRRAEQFPSLRHVELDRIRSVVFALAGGPRPATLTEEAGGGGRPSVHALPATDLAAWTAELRRMLEACGQDRLAERVVAGSAWSLPRRLAVRVGVPGRSGAGGRRGTEVLPVHRSRGRTVRSLLQSDRVARWRRKIGPRDRVVRTLAQKEEIRTALLVDASATAGSTRAVVAGLKANASQPEVVWLHDATPRFLPRRVRGPGERVQGDIASRMTDEDGRLRRVDLVVLGRHARLGQAEREALSTAKIVVLDGINVSSVQEIHASLIADECFELVTHNEHDYDGYSAFRRIPASRREFSTAGNHLHSFAA